MRLRTKVAASIIFATSATSFLIGASILSWSYQAAITEFEQTLNSFAKQIDESDEDKVSIALLLGESHGFNINYIESDGSKTSLVEKFDQVVRDRQLYKTIDLGFGEKLEISADITNIAKARQSSELLNVGFSIAGGLFSGLLALLLIRKDLNAVSKLTNEALQISRGQLDEISDSHASQELITLSKALQSMTNQLQASRHRLRTFLGDASHELKTPLTVIRGYLDLLNRPDGLNEEKRAIAIQRSLSESLRMQKLINDMLLLAELEEAPRLDKTNFELADLIRDHIRDLQTLQPARRVEVHMDPSTGIFASRDLMEQLLSNIFQNITRYTNQKDLVRVTLSSTEDLVKICIEDSGPGIANLNLGHIEDSFNRFDQLRSREAGGSGLGLSIMAKIVESHSGTLVLTRSSLGGLKLLATLPK
jgi:signal transduction histidine kinase